MSGPVPRERPAAAAAQSLQGWAERLSDRIRAALGAGDLAAARQLALSGDGQARSLEKEYALMYRGLGITIRILLDLLGETVGRRAGPERQQAERALSDCLGRFRRDMEALLLETWGERGAEEAVREAPAAPGAGAAGTLGEELARTARVLGHAESLLLAEHARRSQEIVRAIESGDVGQARALLDRKERDEYLPLHDRLVRFMAEVFGEVLSRFGPAELLRFHRATAERQREGFEKWERLPPAEFARTTLFLLKQHMGRVEIREDGEKFTIVQSPCGSGGRLRLAGAYSGPGALPMVEGPGPLTLGQPRFPVYCSHCPIWNSVAAVEWFGRPQWVFEDPSRADGSCTLHIYKRRDAVPEGYYRRLGLAPPGR